MIILLLQEVRILTCSLTYFCTLHKINPALYFCLPTRKLTFNVLLKRVISLTSNIATILTGWLSMMTCRLQQICWKKLHEGSRKSHSGSLSVGYTTNELQMCIQMLFYPSLVVRTFNLDYKSLYIYICIYKAIFLFFTQIDDTPLYARYINPSVYLLLIHGSNHMLQMFLITIFYF